jgi:hypothetical protein
MWPTWARARTSNLAEFGVSVAAHARGRGYGARLFDHAVLRARIRGVDTMIIHALTENTAMLRIARKAGATVERDGSDSEARLKLPPENFGIRLEALMSDQAAEFDYSVKSQAQFMQMLSSWMGADLAWPRAARRHTRIGHRRVSPPAGAAYHAPMSASPPPLPDSIRPPSCRPCIWPACRPMAGCCS